MDCLSSESPVQRVVMMFAAQTGKTEAGSNWLGYVIDHAPGPMLCVQPTIEMAKRLSKQRLESMITETPVLAAKIAPARSRDSGNTMFSKEFSGGIMLMAGANSATGLRSAPCRYLFCDEVDAFPADVDGEGDPVSLAERRTTTFARRKILLTSTPTVKDFSRIEAEYERSDQRRFYVPCPSCGAMEWLKWGQLKWADGRPETARINVSTAASGSRRCTSRPCCAAVSGGRQHRAMAARLASTCQGFTAHWAGAAGSSWWMISYGPRAMRRR
jgi:phage terminase large subunit GpA-like protein